MPPDPISSYSATLRTLATEERAHAASVDATCESALAADECDAAPLRKPPVFADAVNRLARIASDGDPYSRLTKILFERNVSAPTLLTRLAIELGVAKSREQTARTQNRYRNHGRRRNAILPGDGRLPVVDADFLRRKMQSERTREKARLVLACIGEIPRHDAASRRERAARLLFELCRGGAAS